MAIAASLAVSRLTRDSEITAIRSAGVSLRRICLPVVLIGFALSLCDLGIGDYVVPAANARLEHTLRMLTENARILVPQEGQVVQSSDHKYTASIGRIELAGKVAHLRDVMLMVRLPRGDVQSVLLAPTADYRDGVWTLYNARIHIYDNGGLHERFLQPERATINFRIAERVFNAIYLQLPFYSPDSARSLRDMAAQIAAERSRGWVNPQHVLELNFKLSVPFACLVFAFLCPPISLRLARAGPFVGVLLSIVLVFVYWNTLLAARIIGARYPHVLPPLIAAWGQNLVFAAAGAWLLRRSE
jgi:lipopolysaccharide export system permease protein